MKKLRLNPGVAFALPALVVLALLIVYPLIYTIIMSFQTRTGGWAGLANYERILPARVTLIALKNTFVYVFWSIVFQVGIGTAAGILLDQRFAGRATARSVLLIPWVIPGIVAATTWAWMFHSEFGIINYMLVEFGIIDQPVNWLSNIDTVLPALIAINVWKMFPFVAIMVLAGLQSVDKSLYEAARVDGASFADEVRFIMIPQLRPVLAAVTLLLVIWGLNGITIIYSITQGGPANRSLITPIQIYQTAFETFRLNDAAALSVAFFIFVSMLAGLYIYLTQRGELD
ncbi:carbohydrate ABC transporter permease [Consotaella aegiceratis]|uniref:carbohydrate ABC transporter permease n=1 Tax=Consotaella aegiceratis TaxID=3097961 RepID=UPI002F3FDFF6